MIPHPEWQWRWLDNGLILPWFTKSCLEWLLTHDLSKSTVLEWGIGVDIPWWCRACERFIGVEHDPGDGKDHENVKPPPNAVLMYAGVEAVIDDDADTENNYVRAGVMAMHEWDPNVVVIDGIYRVGCAVLMRKAFGMPPWGSSKLRTIIVDNAEYPGLQVIRKEFEAAGLKRTSYVQPDHAEGWTTDVWEVPR